MGTVAYSLPSTTLSFEVEAVLDNFYAGPYAKYAAKYLGIEVRTQDESSCRLTSVKMTPYAEADLSRRYLLNLEGMEAATAFSSADTICLDIQAPSGFHSQLDDQAASAEVPVTVVLQDNTGMIVDYFVLSANWESMWSNGHYVVCLPRTPQTADTYQVSLYFNHQSVCENSFTIS